MALEQNLILNLPFDEADGSTVAYDFAANRHDAEITGCPFVAGHPFPSHTQTSLKNEKTACMMLSYGVK